jgi:hypothetical protein
MQYKFKAGDRVKHVHDDGDQGTFIRYNRDGNAIILWDRDEKITNITKNLYLITTKDVSNKEQDAVMLLLSLGYTISKGNQ